MTNSPNHSRLATNPFSTCCVRPGAMEYVFSPGPKAAQLIDRLRDTGCWGQIVGPHGSGKSTLVASILPHLEHAGYRPVLLTLQDGQRRLPRRWQATVNAPASSATRQPAKPIIVVDGYEQLGWLSGRNLRRTCLARRWGLVVTTHASVGLPMLYRTSTNLDLVQRLVVQLLAGRSAHVSREVVEQTFASHQGDLRSVFFDLFDHYEQLRD